MSIDRSFSLEFSPPIKKRGETLEDLSRVASELAIYNPSFMTVTYGAGGGQKGGTYETLEAFQRVTPHALGCHLTHISDTKGELYEHLDRLAEMGISRIVALRGDLSKDGSWSRKPKGDYFTYTNQFVDAIVRYPYPFKISVGAYPEKHPNSATLEEDIKTLKMKCDAGATDALTQFFFDNQDFLHFREETEKAGITTPIVPGLMRIADFEGVKRFALKIDARIPEFLHKAFAHSADPRQTSEEILYRQMEDLKRNGVDRFHLYTMNHAWGLERSLRLAAS